MVREEITIEGHIIDSLMLTHVLEDIITFGGDFNILEVNIGRTKNDRSHARVEVIANTREQLSELLTQLGKHGAIVHANQDVEIEVADMDGAFPERFHATTNQKTLVRWQGDWHEVLEQEMDCGIRHDEAAGAFRCVPMVHVRKGDRIVCGHRGVKIIPYARERDHAKFEFMSSNISTEKPKNALIRQCALEMRNCKRAGNKLLLVGGPAIIHTGATEHIERLIKDGYIHILFAGNALATHDIEHALYGTSLGVYIEKATLADTGHEHHLRAINTIRRCGGIRRAVEQGILKRGVMHACVEFDVDFVLAGSVRDDGPLPDVEVDMLAAQDRMRSLIKDVGFALMVATGLHSIATGNLLPAWIPAFCVDISPSILTKLADRGSFQTVGLVTDVEPFFRELVHELAALESQQDA